MMYEIGIAHASRLSEEVVLVRDDDDPLTFDIAGVRVHRFPKGNTIQRELFVRQLIADSLTSIDDRRSLAVKRALQALSPPMFWVLHSMQEIEHPRASNVREALLLNERLDTIGRLLDAGMIEPILKPVSDDFLVRPMVDLFCYRSTPFGGAVYLAARQGLGFNPALGRWLQTPEGRQWIETQRT